ncbi:MAG: DUF1294 domain-containing protein [Clostridia bacterium]|nr:DUF1294 domain-containing protein [Clostridia bacterium]
MGEPLLKCAIYLGWIVVMSLIALIAFLIDKKKAIDSDRRIEEKTLLALCVFGGGVGALIGRNIARHKTKKFYFTLIILVSVVSQLGLAAVFIAKAIAAGGGQ